MNTPQGWRGWYQLPPSNWPQRMPTPVHCGKNMLR